MRDNPWYGQTILLHLYRLALYLHIHFYYTLMHFIIRKIGKSEELYNLLLLLKTVLCPKCHLWAMQTYAHSFVTAQNLFYINVACHIKGGKNIIGTVKKMTDNSKTAWSSPWKICKSATLVTKPLVQPDNQSIIFGYQSRMASG